LLSFNWISAVFWLNAYLKVQSRQISPRYSQFLPHK